MGCIFKDRLCVFVQFGAAAVPIRQLLQSSLSLDQSHSHNSWFVFPLVSRHQGQHCHLASLSGYLRSSTHNALGHVHTHNTVFYFSYILYFPWTDLNTSFNKLAGCCCCWLWTRLKRKWCMQCTHAIILSKPKRKCTYTHLSPNSQAWFSSVWFSFWY